MFTCVRPIHKQKVLVWCYGCAGVRLAGAPSLGSLCCLRLNCSVQNEKARDREVAGYEREPAIEGLVTGRAQSEPVR